MGERPYFKVCYEKSEQKRKEAQKKREKREKSAHNFIKTGERWGQRPFINFIKKQAFWYKRASIKVSRQIPCRQFLKSCLTNNIIDQI